MSSALGVVRSAGGPGPVIQLLGFGQTPNVERLHLSPRPHFDVFMHSAPADTFRIRLADVPTVPLEVSFAYVDELLGRFERDPRSFHDTLPPEGDFLGFVVIYLLDDAGQIDEVY